jgi:hypothetical protein
MEQSSSPSIGQFFRVAYWDWAARMTGALTVPFTAAAILLPPKWDYVRGLFGLMAASCLFISAYRVWAQEREQRISLEKRLAPRLRIEFDPGEPKFMSPTHTVGNYSALYVRVIARATSPIVRNCRGFLQSVPQWDGERYMRLFDEPLQLPWSCEQPSSIQPKDLNHEVDSFLDVAWFVDPQEAKSFPPFGFLNMMSSVPLRFQTIQRDQIISHPERNLKLDLLITGEDCENATLSLNIHRGQAPVDIRLRGWTTGGHR